MAASEVSALSPFWPDPLAYGHGDQATQDANAAVPGSGLNLYVFGFRNVTKMTDAQVTQQRGQAQISAPLLAFDENKGVRVQLSNLGLSQRPDLVDGHTIHWHGFVNEAPVFDGVPELSLSVPIGRSFTYYYVPRDAGTYMYHCHFEDVEHVQMGMTGLLFVRPQQNSLDQRRPKARLGGGLATAPLGYAYNDFVLPTDARSTAYDREYSIFESEIFAEGHYRDAHIQTTDWTDFKASFWALNGRSYPDTVDAERALQHRSGIRPLGSLLGGRLQYQPQSALITAKEGDRVLLRLASLGYQDHVMTADNLTFTVIAKDASLLRNRISGAVGNTNPANYAYNYLTTNQLEVGPGESMDALFTAPPCQDTAGYDSYLFYDRNYAYSSNGGAAGKPGRDGHRDPHLPQGEAGRPVAPQRDEGGVTMRTDFLSALRRRRSSWMVVSALAATTVAAAVLPVGSALGAVPTPRTARPTASCASPTRTGRTPSRWTPPRAMSPRPTATRSTCGATPPPGALFQLPGPTLCVTSGTTVTVTLRNSLPEATSITWPGRTTSASAGSRSHPSSTAPAS